jgi:general secretion pathway protein H
MFTQKQLKHSKSTFRQAVGSGFTLIELLVVMIIIGVMIGSATMMLKRDYTDLLANDANRLKALVVLGRDEALFQSRSLGLRFAENSYDFVIGGEELGTWVPLQDKQFRKRQLAKGVQLEIFRQNTLIDLIDEENKKPQVFLLSTGEVTPFMIELVYPAKAKLQLSFDGLGQPKIISNEVF